MAGLAPGIALFFHEVGEVHAAVTAVGLEVVERLGGSVEVEDSLQAVAGPLDGGYALGLGKGAESSSSLLTRAATFVDEHGVEDAVLP